MEGRGGFTWPFGNEEDTKGVEKGLYIDLIPKRGKALIWPSVLYIDLTTKDYRTWYQSLPVTIGSKYLSNSWIIILKFN